MKGLIKLTEENRKTYNKNQITKEKNIKKKDNKNCEKKKDWLAAQDL